MTTLVYCSVAGCKATAWGAFGQVPVYS